MSIRRVYIAGPIAGKPDGNRAAFRQAAKRIARRHWQPVNPLEVEPHPHEGQPCPERGYAPGEHDSGHTSSCCFMRADMTVMLTCDAIYLLEGWEHSRGARDEFVAACAAGLDVLFEAQENVIERTQDEVAEWVARNFGNENELATFGGMVEEAGEVLRAAVKRSQGIRGTRAEWDAEVRKEVADVFVKLCDIAQYEGFSLAEAIAERWADVRQRDWVNDKQGHGIQDAEHGAWVLAPDCAERHEFGAEGWRPALYEQHEHYVEAAGLEAALAASASEDAAEYLDEARASEDERSAWGF